MSGTIIIADFEVLSDKASHRNGWNDVDGVYPAIIQLGAVKVSLDDFKLADQFNVLAIPRDPDGRKVDLPQHIQNLTGITQARMDQEGVELEEATDKFRTFIGDLPVYTYSRTFDFTMLTMSMVNQGLTNLFNRRQFKDVRPLFIKGGVPAERMPQNESADSAGASPLPVNSGRIAAFFGINMEGHAEHDGLKDTLSIHAALKHLLEKGAITPADFTALPRPSL